MPFTCLLLWLLLLKNCHKLFSISSHLDYPDTSEVVRQLFSVRAKRKWSFIISCFIMAIYSPNTFTCIVWQRIHFFQLSPAINPSWLYQQLLLQLTTKNKNLQHRSILLFLWKKRWFSFFSCSQLLFLPFSPSAIKNVPKSSENGWGFSLCFWVKYGAGQAIHFYIFCQNPHWTASFSVMLQLYKICIF